MTLKSLSASHKANKKPLKKSVSTGILFTIILLCTSCGSSKQTAVVPTPAPATQDPTQPKMPNGEQVLLTFCMDESFDKPGEYMAGLGIAEGRPDRNVAIADANESAKSDIATRFVGTLENCMTNYRKDTNVPGNKKMYSSSMEGGLKVIGRAVIDKYANAVCRKITQEATGGYVCYVALHIMLDDAKKGVADELEVRKVDYDKQKFFEKMDEELAKEAARRQAEMDAMQ